MYVNGGIGDEEDNQEGEPPKSDEEDEESDSDERRAVNVSTFLLVSLWSVY